MDSEYPPLPSPSPSLAGPPRGPTLAGGYSFGKITASKNGNGAALDGSKTTIYKVLSDDGDVVLEYVDRQSHSSRTPAAPARYRWQVSSASLMRNSPYFSALLDPNKFAEGRRFEESKSRLINQPSSGVSSSNEAKSDSADVSSADDLPLVNLNMSRLSGKHRIDVLELFLKVLCLNSPSDSERQTRLDEEIRHQPVSLIAGLIDIADLFSSPQVVRDTLKRAGYAASVKGKVSLTTFSPSLLKLSEERMRQIIYITMFLDEHVTFQVLTHSLIVLGSASWVNGVGRPDAESPRWSYLPNGIEEELYYRRQCVLNTITDLQAHFLRLYGALEDDPSESRTSSAPPKSRPIQCRWGFSNSRACDSFHLGEMTRFFALRTKTIFLGSTLIDPGFEDEFSDGDGGYEDDQDDDDFDSKNHDNITEAATAGHDDQQQRTSTAPAPGDDNNNNNNNNNILAITASLRQIPDYQIDSNHTGCGIRRRLLPLLDCIDRFTGGGGRGRGLLGLALRAWKSSTTTTGPARRRGTRSSRGKHKNKNNPNSWTNRSLRRAEMVEIRASKIVAIRYAPIMPSTFPGSSASASASPSSSSSALPPPSSPEEEARLFFTAKKRNWES